MRAVGYCTYYGLNLLKRFSARRIGGVKGTSESLAPGESVVLLGGSAISEPPPGNLPSVGGFKKWLPDVPADVEGVSHDADARKHWEAALQGQVATRELLHE